MRQSKGIMKVIAPIVMVPALLGRFIAPPTLTLWPLSIWPINYVAAVIIAVTGFFASLLTCRLFQNAKTQQAIDIEDLALVMGFIASLVLAVASVIFGLEGLQDRKSGQKAEQSMVADRDNVSNSLRTGRTGCGRLHY